MANLVIFCYLHSNSCLLIGFSSDPAFAKNNNNLKKEQPKKPHKQPKKPTNPPKTKNKPQKLRKNSTETTISRLVCCASNLNPLPSA